MAGRRTTAAILAAALGAALCLAAAAQAWEARVLGLPTDDVVYDPVSQRIYVSLPSFVGPHGNSIAAIDPRTGRIGEPVWVGSEPNHLAVSDDGSTLWVVLETAFAIRRVALPALVPGIQFVVQTDFGRELGVEDIEVQPGNPDVIAVSRQVIAENTPPFSAGVAIYENGVRRPLEGPLHVFANRIEFDEADPTLLFGGQNEGSPPTSYHLRVNDDGVTLIDETFDPPGGVGLEMELFGGRLYQSGENVVDPYPTPPRWVGTFPELPGTTRNVVVDPTAKRAYFLYHAGVAIYDIESFAKLDQIEIPGIRGFPQDLALWGPGALAFNTTEGQLYFFTTGIFDLDGDGVSDRVDNCRALANPAQADDDRDGAGDLCDLHPGQSDGVVPQCRYDLLGALGDLAACWAEPRFVDADQDGVHDGNDRCPGTQLGHAVDPAGCDAEQFCAASVAACERADWRNDEPLGKPRDCRRFGSKREGYQCSPG